MDKIEQLPVSELIALLARQGIQLGLAGSQLTVRSAGPVDAALKDALRARKPELVESLATLAVPATSTQRRLWWLSDGGADSNYTVLAAYRLRGALEAALFARAADAVLARHAVFATRWRLHEGELVQHGGGALPQMAQGTCDETALSALLADYVATAFTIEAERVMRHGLYRMAPDEHVYILACHHAVIDGRSLEIYFDELAQAYAAFERRLPWEPAPVARFADHARLLGYAGTDAHEASLAYWEAQLAGLGAPPAWPAGPPEPQADALFSAALQEDLVAQVHAFCRTQDVSPFAVYYAAYKLTLAKTRGAYDFVVGTPVLNRGAGMEEMLGCFMNAVPLRALPRPDMVFSDYVRQVQQESMMALAYQDTPLDLLAARLQAGGNAALPGVFDTLFALQSQHGPRIAQVTATPLTLPVCRAKFPLSLIADVRADATMLHWECSGRHLGRAGAADLHERYTYLLAHALRAAGTALAGLALAPPEPVQDDRGPEGDLLTRFRAIAGLHAERCAYRDPQRAWTYAELDAASDALAACLQEQGVRPGAYVGVLPANGGVLAITLLAVLKAGAAYVPVRTSEHPEREDALRMQVGITHCIGPSATHWAGLPCVDPEQAHPGRRPLAVQRNGTSVAYVNFSSGTTGTAKAIACTDLGVLRLVTHQQFARLDDTIAMLNAAPVDFDAFTLELWAPLLNGGCCVGAGNELPTPQLMRQLIADAGVNTAWLTSALFNTLVDLDPACFDGLRQLLVGGDLVSPHHVARVYAHCPEIQIINGYGPTENTTFTACYPIPRDWPATRSVPIGKPIRGTAAYVLDVDGRPAPHGVTGELVVTGAGVAVGYLGQPDLTARAFTTLALADGMHRCYRTGDHAWADADGVLHFTGRRDGQVKVNGKRVELARIENVLRSHPQVQDAGVLLVQKGTTQQLAAFIVAAQGAEHWETSLDAHLRNALEPYQRPHVVVAVATMPMTPNGKLDRGALLELVRESATNDAAPRTMTASETQVAAIWNEVLGRTASAPDANFFQLGGNSLLAMRMLALINERCGARLRFSDMAAGPTIGQLAARLGAARQAPSAVNTPLFESPLSTRQRLLWTQARMVRDNSAYNVHANYVLRGPLDGGRLGTALRAVYLAHAALHVRFSEQDGEALQQARPDPAWHMETCDIEEHRLGEWLELEARRTFDLEQGPVFIARLLHISSEHHVLQLNFPHIVMDGWSFNVVWQDISKMYADPAASLPGSDLGAYAAGAVGTAAANAYWCEQLARSAIARLPLSDAPFPTETPFVYHNALAQADMAALRHLAQVAGVSLFAAGFALHQLLMSQLFGQERFVVSTPYANRDGAGAHAWVGYYAAMLPVACEIAAGTGPVGMVRAVAAKLVDGMAHAELDMAWVLDHAGVEGGREGNPLQRLVFAWQEGIGADSVLGDATAQRVATVQSRPKFPLMLAVEGSKETFTLRWEFDPRLLTMEQIEALDRGYRVLLAAAAAEPAMALASLPRVVQELPPAPAAAAGAVPKGSPERMRKALAAVWSRVLARPVAPEDNAHFFRLGGNSLLCLRVQAELSREHGIDAAIGMLLRYPEMQVLAERLAAVSSTAQPLEKAVHDGVMPLTAEQRRLWFVHCLQPTSAYNVPVLFEVAGKLDTERMEAALTELARRHVGLRFNVRDRDGEPEQHVVDPSRFVLRAEHIGAGHLHARLERESTHVFDLEHEFPVRALALDVDDGTSYLLLNVHHIFMDGQSLKTVKDELAALYAGQSLPAPRFDYADVVAWQQTGEYRELVERDTAYWRKRLEGAPVENMLPADLDAPERLGVAVKYRVRLPDDMVHRVDALCRHTGVSKFAFWLATFGLALARVTDQDDVVIAIPAANRPRPEFHAVVGFMANTLPVRVSPGEDQPFAGYLADLGARLATDLAHQACPLDALTGIRKDTLLPPLSQVLFSAAEHAVVNTDAWTLRTRPLGNASTKYPLSVNVAEVAEETVWSFEYDAGRYSAHVIRGFSAAILELIGQALAAPQCTVGQLALAPTPAAAAPAVPALPMIMQRIQATVDTQPEATGLWGKAGPMRYSALWKEVARHACALQSRGVGHGQRVGILMRRTDALPITLLAVVACGAVYVPLDPNYPADRVRYILADAQPSLVITDDLLLVDEFAVTQPVLSLQEMLSHPVRGDWQPHVPQPDDLAYIIYTSGSTGKPKGVAIRHESVAWLAQWAQDCYSRDDMRNVLAATSVCFDLSVFEIFVTLAVGGGLSFAENLLDLIDAPRLRNVTMLNTVPSLLEETMRHTELPASLLVVNLAGEALHRTLADRIHQRVPHARLFNLYGPSEDTTYSTCALVAPGANGPVTIGTPLGGTEARILDRQGRALPDGIPGELYLSGKGLAAGYFNRDELTAERFIHDRVSGTRMYKTGDKVRRLENGELEYLGRLDHQCKLRGYRIELGEIERNLMALPNIRESAVVICLQGTPEARLCGFFTADAGDVDAASLRTQLLKALPSYMVPADLIEIDAMPLTPSGKLDRQALQTMALSVGVAVLDAEETIVGQVAANRLGISVNDADTNCVCGQDGGDGVEAMVEGLAEAFGIRLSYSTVLGARTVANLANEIRAAREESNAAKAASILL